MTTTVAARSADTPETENTRPRVFAPNRARRRGARRRRRARSRCSRGPGTTTGSYDSCWGVVFLNNRYHDPMLGTFVSVDPLVTRTGEAYVYGAANPVTFSDPSGLEVCYDDPSHEKYGQCYDSADLPEIAPGPGYGEEYSNTSTEEALTVIHSTIDPEAVIGAWRQINTGAWDPNDPVQQEQRWTSFHSTLYGGEVDMTDLYVAAAAAGVGLAVVVAPKITAAAGTACMRNAMACTRLVGLGSAGTNAVNETYGGPGAGAAPVVNTSFQFPGAGRSGSGVKSFVGPANSVVKAASEGRVFVTDDLGRVILDVTSDRVKPVVPGQGFIAGDGRKLAPSAQHLKWIDELWGDG